MISQSLVNWGKYSEKAKYRCCESRKGDYIIQSRDYNERISEGDFKEQVVIC